MAASLLFRLRGVPFDEAEDIRELLTENQIAYYETPPGNWGISMPAIWLHESAQLEQAQELIRQYQTERLTSQRAAHRTKLAEGQSRTFMDEVKANPFRVVFYVAVVVAIVYLSTYPFLDFAKQ